MSERITVVVGGFDALARSLTPVPQLEQVLSVNSTSELRTVITGNQIPKNDSTRVVFIFADTLLVDTDQTLAFLVAQLTTLNWKVLVVELSPKAVDLVRDNPKAGFLQGPFKVNDVLYAISNLNTAAGVIPPYEHGYEVIDFDNSPWPSAPPAPAPTARPEATPTGWSRPDGVAVTPPAPPAPAPAPAPTSPSPPVPAPATASPSPPAPLAPPASPPPPPPPPLAPPTSAPLAPPTWPAPQPPPAPAPANTWAAPPPTADLYYPSAPARPLTPHADAPYVAPGDYRDAPQYAQPRRARVISVASPKGGTGKSSLTLNLAVALGLRLRQFNKRICVIDANFQQADAGKLLDKYSPNIVQLSKDRSAIVPEQIERYLIHRADLNISALLGPAIPEEANPALFTGALYTTILEALRPKFDYIFIDTPVAELYHDIFNNFALPQSDFIIVPITPAYHTIMNADSWLNKITQPTFAAGQGVNPDNVGIVLNQQRDNVGITELEIQEELFRWKYLGSIPDTNEWVRCLNNNELIATKGIHEINAAFGQILYAATKEPEMLYGIGLETERPARKSLFSGLRKKR